MAATIVQDDNQFIKGPKRKRLTKACDPCHKSKRRCDGAMPCSNCYYASKQCSYTDASGRPVPPPRTFNQDRADASVPGSSRIPPNAPPLPTQYPLETRYPTFPPHPQPNPQQNRISNQPNGYPPSISLSPTATSSSTVTPGPSQQVNLVEHSEDERLALRKRLRSDRLHGDDMPVDSLPVSSLGLGSSVGTIERPVQVNLDHGLTRELTNLFFTHCHPAHAIIHKPSFSTALQLNRVPPYLLHAVCALAAPLSKQPRLRTNPMRNAGRPFAQEAMTLMFDGAGRLKVDLNLATAQALCLLQLHEMHVFDTSTGAGIWGTRYHDLALQIIDSLGVHLPEHPTLTPVPSPEFIHKSVEHECVRRIFWLIYVVDVMNGLYFKKRGAGWERAVAGAGMPGLGRNLIGRIDEGGRFNQTELKLRLPADETSFELAVHSTLPEYLYLPAIRTQYASEFGHLIRVLTIYAKIEHALDLLNDPEAQGDPSAALQEAEQALDAWAKTLPDHLRFSEQSLQVQLSMFETSSNTGAWCYCMIHVLHASAALGLNAARHRSQWAYQRPEVQWAISHLESVTSTLGARAKNSVLLGAVIWSMVKYTKVDDAKIRAWVADHEDFTSVKMHELAQKEWRVVHSPQQQHSPYPPQLPHSHPHPPQRSLPQPQPSHQHQQLSQHQNPLPHRRLSEVRPPPLLQNNPIPVPRPPPHQHGGDVSYNNRGRSPSNSPSAYSASHPGVKPLDEARLHGGRGSGPMQGSDRERDRDRDRERIDVRMNGLGAIGGSGSGLVGSAGESKDVRRMVGDSDIDPSLQSDGSGGTSQGSRRNEAGGNGEGPQSLPSLKASGLLDWQRDAMSIGSAGNVPMQSTLARSPPTSMQGHEPMETRSTGIVSSSMPVGLPWLANE